MNRTANGTTLNGETVVAADAIAMLAGVPLATVRKVLIATYALSSVTPHSLSDLVKCDSLPMEPADDVRFDATEAFIDPVIHELQKKPYRALASELRIERRFKRITVG